VIAALPEGAWNLKPSQAEFSVCEHVCHLRDLEAEGFTPRIDRLLHETDPFLPDFDRDRLARERDYNSQSASAALDAFASARQANVRRMSGWSRAELGRRGSQEHVGAIRSGSFSLPCRNTTASTSTRWPGCWNGCRRLEVGAPESAARGGTGLASERSSSCTIVGS